jgi:hypothetical protein
MELYHVSEREYSENQVVKAVTEGASRGPVWVDERLDSGKPDECPERQSAVFAFDDLGFCRVYARSEGLVS